MKIAIFGATGGTGQQLVQQGLAGGHSVAAFVLQQLDDDTYLRQAPAIS